MAVVPCCVFADLFSWRRLKKEDNEIFVRTYSEFIEYLEQKSSKIQSDYLPLQGRNRILFNFE